MGIIIGWTAITKKRCIFFVFHFVPSFFRLATVTTTIHLDGTLGATIPGYLVFMLFFLVWILTLDGPLSTRLFGTGVELVKTHVSFIGMASSNDEEIPF